MAEVMRQERWAEYEAEPNEPGKINKYVDALRKTEQLEYENTAIEVLEDAFKRTGEIVYKISDELASQYTIGYASKNPRRDGAWRRIDVRVTRPNAAARTRAPRYASAAGPSASRVSPSG